MNKTKVLIVIAKLLGTVLVLSLLLITMSLIELFQAIYAAKAEKPVLLLTAAKEPPKPTAIPPLPDITYFLPKRRAIINQLPRDYLTVKMLKQWAKEKGVKGYSRMLKSQLVKVHSYKLLGESYETQKLGIA